MNATDKDVEREDRQGVGRSAKIGLALIAILAMIFVGLLIMKLSGTDDSSVANGSKKQSTANKPNQPLKSPKTSWKKHRPRSSSFDEPTVVPPAPKKTRNMGTKRPNRWSMASSGTSPDMSMMPNTSTGSSTAGDIAVGPAPLPSNDRYQPWNQSSNSNSQAQPSNVPADVFTPPATQNTNSQTYPNNTPTQNPYYTGNSPYPSYPSNSSTGSASSEPDDNPYRRRDNLGRHHADYPPHDPKSQGNYGYPHERRGSRSYGRHDNSGYEPAPYSPKTARPYSRDNHSSSSTSSYRYNPKSYHDDSYKSPTYSNSSVAGLGSRRNDGKYIVGPNESFSTIAEKLYGTDAFYQALAEFNRTNYPDENRLRVGDVIVAPDESELMETYPDLCPSPERRKVIRSRISSVSTGSQYRTGPTYTVQQGDTLFDIARFKLGSGTRWPEIYELNQDVLQGDFNYVTPGIVLALPEDGSSDAVTQRPASERY